MTAQVTSISAQEFQHLYKDHGDKLYIIDLRTHAEVENESLGGTSHFPVQTLTSAILQDYLDQQGHQPDQPIYLLCAGGPRASLAAENLKQVIDAQLIIIAGGLNGLTTLQYQGQRK